MLRDRLRHISWGGLAGLLGFLGFKYFSTGDPGDLLPFSFFAFFSFFIIGRLGREIPDERLTENLHKAGYIAFFVAACFLFFVVFFATSPFYSRELIIITAILGWVVSLFTYAIALQVFERS